MQSEMQELAINGGSPVRVVPFPKRTPFDDLEIKELTSAVNSQILFSPDGSKAREFEKKFADMYGVHGSVMCSSGTAAIHMAVAALDLDPGSEIIVSPVTDIGSTIGIIYQGCIPIFADWKQGTINMDPLDMERKITDKTRAVIVVHLGGDPCDIDSIMNICQRHDLPLIEDCCQAYLAKYKGKLLGTFGQFGCFSMQQSKHLVAGEGGVTISANADLTEKMALFRDKGWERWDPSPSRRYSMLGLNYRPNELSAAVALAQLTKIQDVVQKRRHLAKLLTSEISGNDVVSVPESITDTENVYWFYPYFINDVDPKKFTQALRFEGIPAELGYTGKPIYLCSEVFTKKRTFGNSSYPFNSQYYDRDIEYKEGLCPIAEESLNRLGILRIIENWTEEDILDIVTAIKKVSNALLL